MMRQGGGPAVQTRLEAVKKEPLRLLACNQRDSFQETETQTKRPATNNKSLFSSSNHPLSLPPISAGNSPQSCCIKNGVHPPSCFWWFPNASMRRKPVRRPKHPHPRNRENTRHSSFGTRQHGFLRAKPSPENRFSPRFPFPHSPAPL